MEIETSKKIISWQEVLRNSLYSAAEFYAVAKRLHSKDLDQIQLTTNDHHQYPFFLPLDLAQEIIRLGPKSFLWKQFIPSLEEINTLTQVNGLLDPIGDQKNHVAPQLIHRYNNRVLFLPTTKCPIQCRYCFRKNELHQTGPQQQLFSPNFDMTLNYLKNHPEIEEIIFTGGDPLILNDSKIDDYLSQFAQIPHLKFIRFHTRFLTSIPERINSNFLELLNFWSKRFTLSLMIHTNHLSEWYRPTHLQVLSQLAKLPIHLGSQTVLLKYHQVQDLVDLFKFLITHQVKPYYLHHPDRVKGAMHFFISENEGMKIYQELRQHLPGWAIPHYVQDSPILKQKKIVATKT